MKLRTRIQLLTTGLLVVLLLAAHIGIYEASDHLLVKSVTDRLDDESEDILQSFRNETDVSTSQLIKASTPSNGMVRVVSADDQVLSLGTQSPDLRKLDTHYVQTHKTVIRDTSNGRIASVYFPLIWSDGRVVSLEMTETLYQEEKTLTVLRGVLIVSVLFILLPVIFGTRLLARIITKPIAALLTTMDDIEQSGSFQVISEKRRRHDELGLLTRTFNRMIHRLEGNFTKQEQFVSNASHELKTPLTVIDSYASVLARWGKNDPDVRDEAISSIQTETKRMQHLVEQLLDLARHDQQSALNLERQNITQLTRDAVQRMQHVTDDAITLSAPDLTIIIDAEKWQQLLFILLDNAIKYGDEPIQLSLTTDDNGIVLTVADNGPGIDAEERKHVFDRFFRVDKARSRSKGGTGLGLSLAFQIVQAHEGTISIADHEPRGTEFTIRLPGEVTERGQSEDD